MCHFNYAAAARLCGEAAPGAVFMQSLSIFNLQTDIQLRSSCSPHHVSVHQKKKSQLLSTGDEAWLSNC